VLSSFQKLNIAITLYRLCCQPSGSIEDDRVKEEQQRAAATKTKALRVHDRSMSQAP
jgi:hypothetical protein